MLHLSINKALTQTRYKQTDYHLEDWQPICFICCYDGFHCSNLWQGETDSQHMLL